MSERMLSHLLPVSKLNYPFLTDEYFILDLMYFLLADAIRCGMLKDKEYLLVSDDTIDYLESILEKEDKDQLWEISEVMLKTIIEIGKSEQLAYLTDYPGEILDVQYRYVKEERYVRLFIRLG